MANDLDSDSVPGLFAILSNLRPNAPNYPKNWQNPNGRQHCLGQARWLSGNRPRLPSNPNCLPSRVPRPRPQRLNSEQVPQFFCGRFPLSHRSRAMVTYANYSIPSARYKRAGTTGQHRSLVGNIPPLCRLPRQQIPAQRGPSDVYPEDKPQEPSDSPAGVGPGSAVLVG